ncbi:MAG: 2-oxoacid:acceptor oxidoreductase family protein, partial [Kiritimatiellae bacterium]|nr:2-oxoacid:acceptor oxidoreductase family protein [Kiritimatiellia bacterium]
MNDTTNVTLVGVGGQGILLTADVLARTAAEAGLDVKKSEIHGMSQRGGSVSSQVRFGARVHSPIIPEGETDLLVAFDAVEAVRAFPSVRTSGRALVDRCYLVPITVSSGLQPAPEDPDGALARLYGERLLRVDS